MSQSAFWNAQLTHLPWASAAYAILNLPRRFVDNAYAESFNTRVRMECLGQHWFLDLDDARRKVEAWRVEYNEVRPHSATGERTPMSLIHRPPEESGASKGPEILT